MATYNFHRSNSRLHSFPISSPFRQFQSTGLFYQAWYSCTGYNEYAYYTDTGRCWDGDKYNVWDHVKTNKPWPIFHSTFDIIRAIETNTFPLKAAFNIHPQRWTDNPFAWTKELVLQNVKNVVKLGLKQIKN